MSEHTVTTPAIEISSIATPQPLTFGSAVADARLPEPTQTSKTGWDIAKLRLPQDYAAVAQETVQATVPVGKPGPQTYFRVHPEWQVYVATLTHEESIYLVSAGLCDALEGDLKIKLVVPYMTRDGDIGLWPLNPLQAAGRRDTWTASAHRVLVASRQGWVRMRSNMPLRSYDLIHPKTVWDEPSWTDQDFDSLLEAAFADRVIGTLDHPVVRALAGEA